ncbi:DNA cytosine methyltransferase [Streptomyces cinnamoneus]|uniref:DNA (cytosine-5-)-methyltransferase n=1 Tax=Streptomyces cinnamoneus TaxID=53446 RepID=A0A918WKX0_STRCJ|nr:DNA cytosine methyltransferase [Streptomyces cinnamoneus]GHC52331.1 DNA cytosine methyltransferase [Streptomyces cinnamoneus]
MLTYIDFFCGAGGSSSGAAAVPGVRPVLAANHWDRAITSHAANFPDAEHFTGDLHDADVARFPAADLFWASPECPQWSNARGKRRDFDKQPDLFGETLPDAAADRSRALMWDVPRYLDSTHRRGRPVLAGVIENVIDVRAWDLWQTWRNDIRALGYDTRLIALNSMHARPVATTWAPQSRDRLYLAYWHRSPGRAPDWDKWLRPRAWCSVCEETVTAVQAFKNPRRDMGRYRQQYVYRCPRVSCRSNVLEPEARPAATAIDWTLPAERIGDRTKPLAAATLNRIRAGLAKYGSALAASNRGTRRTEAAPALLVPVEGRDGKHAAPATSPLRTQTARNETGLAWLPYLIPLRGGGDKERARPVTDALTTVTASGNHHGLVTAPGFAPEDAALLVPYYGKGVARPADAPIGALTTRDRYALATGTTIALDDVRFRMLEPGEIGRAMAFADNYRVLGNKREKVRQYGNAVTPPVAEILVSALVEAVTGAPLDRQVVTR